jgi:cell division septum initiation protein DivIVA
MDILQLIDRLEELLNQGKHIPLTHQTLIDESTVFELIDNMRSVIPEEIREAQRTLAQRDRILAQAQEEATRTINTARERSEQYTERDQVVVNAHERADRIIAQAQANAETIRREADDYVLETLARLEVELDRSLTQVRNGVRALQTDQAKAETPAP